MAMKTVPLALSLALAACATQPASVPSVVAPVAVDLALARATAIVVPKGDQWLFGSGEGSAAALQTFRALTDFALAAARKRPRSSVILMPGQSAVDGTAPLSFVPCGQKPLAAVFDADETLIWNIPPTRYNVEHRDAVFE